MSIKVIRTIGAIVAAIFFASSFAIPIDANAATEHVRGHVTKNGKYVPPHMRTKANKTQRDNWSSTGNTNPYTGKRGHKNPKK